MANYNINAVLDYIMYITEQSNIYIDRRHPGALKNSDPRKMNEVLYRIVETVRYIGILMQPFILIPQQNFRSTECSENNRNFFRHLTKEFAIKPCTRISEPRPIFPKG